MTRRHGDTETRRGEQAIRGASLSHKIDPRLRHESTPLDLNRCSLPQARLRVPASPRPGAVALLLALVALALWVLPAYAQAGQPLAPSVGQPAEAGPQGPVSLKDVGFDPHLDAQVPLDLSFRDETGAPVRLRDLLIAGRPVALTLNYYTCQDLCALALPNLADTMDQVTYRLGDEYSVITVSIDPTNTPADATAMKTEVLHRYARPDAPNAAAGWHFLSGDESQIQALAQAVGFRYVYDPQLRDYAHPIGTILLTPDGHVSRYLYGMDFPPNDLRLGLAEASQRVIASPVDAVLLLCYHYNPTTGRYSAAILGALRVAGVVTVTALGTFLAVMWRRDLKGPKGPNTLPPGGLAG